MEKSKIFTDGELKSLEKRASGDKTDPAGTYANRVKPKILELLKRWLPRKRELEKIIR